VIVFLGIVLIVVLGLILGEAFFWETDHLELKREVVEVAEERLNQSVKLLFVSDLHASRYLRPKKIKEKIKRLRAETSKVDAILIGGDLLDTGAREFVSLDFFISEFKEWGVPIYTVLGNHDWQTWIEKTDLFKEYFKKNGIIYLEDQAVSLDIDGRDKINIIGLGDLEAISAYNDGKQTGDLEVYRQRAESLKVGLAINGIDPQKVSVVLSHNPDGVYVPFQTPPELFLAGHTHGGQFWLVDKWAKLFLIVYPKIMPMGSFATWSGRRIIGQSNLLVSRGLGESTIPARWGRKEDAILVTLQPTAIRRDLIIGLSGKPRSGKDTVARMFQVLLPGIQRIGFSYAIKDEFDKENGTNTRFNEKEKDKYRLGLQELGNRRRRDDPNYWVLKVINTPPPLLIKDVRFPLEADMVREKGGFLVRIEADPAILQKRLGVYFAETIQHENEKKLDYYSDWDFVIQNNGSLDDLEQQVRKIVSVIKDR
jgi:phosphomevalonate kinase